MLIVCFSLHNPTHNPTYIYYYVIYSKCPYVYIQNGYILNALMRYFRISPARKIFENVQVFISKGSVCYNILGTL